MQALARSFCGGRPQLPERALWQAALVQALMAAAQLPNAPVAVPCLGARSPRPVPCSEQRHLVGGFAMWFFALVSPW